MIDQEYLERLLADLGAQLREHEGNAAATRGGIQVIQHLLLRCEEGESVKDSLSLEMEVGQHGTDRIQSG